MTDAPAPATPAPAPTFANAAGRIRAVPLDWPVDYDGRTYAEIHIKRLSAAEVAAFVDGLKDGEKFRWPIFVDADGAAVPPAVLDHLDDDDSLRLDEVARDFLPRRFRGTESNDSPPSDGGTTAHT